MPGLGVTYQGPACPHCGYPLDLSELLSGWQYCRGCRRPFEAVRFSPPPRVHAVPAAGGGDGDAACPAHKGNAAVASCERCGVFLCGLCRIETDAQVLCPACFGRLSAGGELVVAQNRFRDYDGVAWLMVVLGLLTVVGGVATGPAAVYFAAQGRRQRIAWGDPPGTGHLLAAIGLGFLNVALAVGVVAMVFSAP